MSTMIKYVKLEKIIEKNLLSEVKWFLAFANRMYHGLRGRENQISPFPTEELEWDISTLQDKNIHWILILWISQV